MNTLKPPFCLRNRTLPVEGGGGELDFCCCCVGNRVVEGGHGWKQLLSNAPTWYRSFWCQNWLNPREHLALSQKGVMAATTGSLSSSHSTDICWEIVINTHEREWCSLRCVVHTTWQPFHKGLQGSNGSFPQDSRKQQGPA